MPRPPLNQLTGLEIARAVAAGEVTCEAVAASCLERIAVREPQLGAWAALDRNAVLAEARALDRTQPRGPLHGVPFGAKDVIDTVDLPTAMGSLVYAGHRPPADAACVALARAAGAVVLGKTVTAEFAGSAPTHTRNPHDPARTSGGSSSGSAAAVADCHVPLALGTQTGGSVLRPASFCGIFGFKPTFGTINPAGVKPAAVSFDTIGAMARSLDDLELFTAVLAGTPVQISPVPERAPSFGVARTHLWDTAHDETKSALETAADRLRAAGATVVDIELPPGYERLTAARAVINACDRARGLAHEWRVAPDRLTEQTRDVCRRGFAIDRKEYVAALVEIETARDRLPVLFQHVDVILTPCAPGEAPEGLDYAGDPRFQELWTLLHTPSMTLPVSRGPNHLPVGLQLVAPRYGETALFAAARWAWAKLMSSGFASAEGMPCS